MRHSIIILLLMAWDCSTHPANNKSNIHQIAVADTGYSWQQLMDSASWRKNYNFQMFSIHGTLWTVHPDGNWFTTDGSSWTKSKLINAIHNLAFLDYVLFNSAVYGLGHFQGNIETFVFNPQITRTTDLKNWTVIAKQSNLPQRFFLSSFYV